MRRLFAAAAAALLAAAPAAAHVVSDRELQVIRQFPRHFFAPEWKTAGPDSEGNVPPNRSGRWRGVGYQAPAVHLLLDASARADTLAAERAWRAFDAALVHQVPGGGFTAESAPDPVDDALWIAGSCRSIAAVTNSAVADRFRFRWALMRPKLQRAVDHLEARGDSVLAARDDDAAALLVIAAAFLLADGTYHDERYGRLGQAALARALALQQPDGRFVHDARDAARHVRALEALQSITIYFPSPTLERASAAAARWASQHRHDVKPPEPGAPAWRGVSRHDADFVLQYAKIRPPAPLGGPSHE